MRKNQTISYDDNEGDDLNSEQRKGLMDKVFNLAGFNLSKFGNFFRGESPTSQLRMNEPLKSERSNYNTKGQSAKPPLYLEKR